MLKKILVAGFCSLLLLSAQNTLACEGGGCGIGSYQFGILPQQTKNFVGIRYQHRTDRTLSAHGSASSENFTSTEIWGRFYPVKRVQVLALLPYNFNSQESEGKVKQVQGLGDALVLVNYNLLNNTDSLYQNVKHNLFLGGGVKLPTGRFDRQSENMLLNPNLQPGTGSFDLVANAMYTIRYNKIGFNTNVTFRHNTANITGYRFGDKFGAGAVLFSVLKVKDVAIMPNAGLSTELAAKDHQHGQLMAESGGHANFMNVGSELYFKSFSGGLTLQKPVSQHVSDGMVKTGNRLLTHLTFMF